MKYFISENIIEEFYDALANEDENRLRRVHIPLSDVFYVRAKYFQDTGNWISLQEMEQAMYLEGLIDKEDTFNG